MRGLLAAVALLILSGCSGPDEAPVAAVEAPPPAEPVLADDVLVLDYDQPYAPDRAIPSTAMEVPAGGKTLHVRAETRGAPCGAIEESSATFTSPSGVASTMAIGAFGPGVSCETPAVVAQGFGEIDLDSEPGTWEVSFSGHGVGATLHLLVMLEPGEADEDA